MDCRNCQPTLIDLLYGELATDAAEAARAHLRDCSNCRGAFEKLSAGLRAARTLELIEPPAQVGEKLLEMAQARAVAIAEQRAAATAPVLSPWRVMLDFLSRFAMARQVGMAMIFLLIVSVGMWSLPQMRRGPGSVPLAQRTAEEAVPSAPAVADGVQPAERLGLKVDAHSGRIRSAEGEAGSVPAAAAMEPAAAASANAAPQVRDADKKAPESARAPVATGKDSSVRAERRALADLEEAKSEGLAKGALHRAPAAHAGSGSGMAANGIERALSPYRTDAPAPAKPAATPKPFPSNDDAAPLLGAAEVPSKKSKAKTLDEVGPGSQAQAGGVGAAPAPPAYTPASPSVEQSQRSGAAAATQPSGTDALTNALQSARALAQRDGCAVALPRYQQIVSAGGSTRAAGEALLDMARCRSALGQPELAHALLEQAARIPAVATRARALLPADQSAPADSPAAGAPIQGK